MQLVTAFALAIALATTAAASDLLLYLDFEQTPPQDRYYLASAPSAAYSFQPLELNALERALRADDGEPDANGFRFDPLELNALARSLQGRPALFDTLIASVPAPTAAFTGRALDRSGAGRDTMAKGNVLLLPDSRSTVAYFASRGRLQFFGSTWWDDSAPKRAMSVLAWVKVEPIALLRLQGQGVPLGAGEFGDAAVPNVLEAPFEEPVSLFPYTTPEGALAWSLHDENQEAIFKLSAPLAVGEWIHIAGTYDATEGAAKLYLNGEEVSGGQGVSELGVYAGPTGVVTLDPAGLLSSWIMDDLNVWRGALSGDEVRAIMEFGPVVENATAVDDGDTVTTWAALKTR
jgi:hypothetical protein